jgi:hypothetical protein
MTPEQETAGGSLVADEHRYPDRVERARAVLTSEWQTFHELFPGIWGLDAKWETGALVWLRNRRLVESRFTAAGVTQWRTRG